LHCDPSISPRQGIADAAPHHLVVCRCASRRCCPRRLPVEDRGSRGYFLIRDKLGNGCGRPDQATTVERVQQFLAENFHPEVPVPFGEVIHGKAEGDFAWGFQLIVKV
jgi:hypothetical protein